MKYKNDFLVIIKGFIIGSSMSVPGISGGTMAILLGIYDKLIHSISNFLSDIKSNFIFLLKFVFGTGLGIGSLAFVIKWLLDRYPYLGVLGISTVVGIFLITKPIEWAMNRYSQQTYFIIIGFVLGSTVEIFRAKILPAIPSEASYTWWIPAALISIVLFVAGFAAINSLSKYSEE